jgi:C-3',4' desaturase CrtD
VPHTSDSYDAIVIGAGVAGLTAATTLANRNVRTLLVERHNVPGGCASFYQRDGYRFDVGATLVGGFGARGVHSLLNAELGVDVSAERIEPSMVVHLPTDSIVRYGDERWRAERLRAFGPGAENFWLVQERIAELAWDLSTRFPALPQDLAGMWALAGAARPKHVALLGTLGRSVASIMPARAPRALRTFVDAQLLITAQTDARSADLAYGCTALDLAREGTFHLPDGVSTLSVALARAFRRAGGTLRYALGAAEIVTNRARVTGVRLDDGTTARARAVVAALPVGDVLALCAPLERSWRARVAALPQRYGAFTLYCGLPPGVAPADFPSHHQVVAAYDEALGEGNSVFLSFSGPHEAHRARAGGRAVTLSTHTDVARWERAYRDGRVPELRAAYTARLLAAFERVLPGAAARAEVMEAADPHTFARYTGRSRGLVGGLPQTPSHATFGAFGHRTCVGGLFLCGDTAFPGQSTVGATLSGYAAGRAALFNVGARAAFFDDDARAAFFGRKAPVE